MVRLNRLFRDWRGQKTKKPLQTRGKGLQRLNRMKMTRTLCYRSPQAIEWYASRARSMEGSEKWWQKGYIGSILKNYGNYPLARLMLLISACR